MSFNARRGPDWPSTWYTKRIARSISVEMSLEETAEAGEGKEMNWVLVKRSSLGMLRSKVTLDGTGR